MVAQWATSTDATAVAFGLTTSHTHDAVFIGGRNGCIRQVDMRSPADRGVTVCQLPSSVLRCEPIASSHMLLCVDVKSTAMLFDVRASGAPVTPSTAFPGYRNRAYRPLPVSYDRSHGVLVAPKVLQRGVEVLAGAGVVAWDVATGAQCLNVDTPYSVLGAVQQRRSLVRGAIPVLTPDGVHFLSSQ